MVGRVGDELLVHVGRFVGLDEAALAAAAGMNLGLDDAPATELFGDSASFGGGGSHAAARHGHAVRSEKVACLVLMQLHWWCSRTMSGSKRTSDSRHERERAEMEG